MNILFYDAVQQSNAPAALTSPALAETMSFSADVPFRVTFTSIASVNSIGVGGVSRNCGIVFQFYDSANRLLYEYYNGFGPNYSGLYMLSDDYLKMASEYIDVKHIDITPDMTVSIGRIGAGYAPRLYTAVAKEPGYASTAEPRRTLSGQIIPGKGGYFYRTLSLDVRYKIDEAAMAQIKSGLPCIARGYPFFIDLTEESYKLPLARLYATEKNQRNMVFQGGVNRFLYSRKFDFEEAF